MLLFRAEHPELRALLRKARADEELSADEFESLASYLHATFMNFQARLQHNASGLFDASVNESYEYILRDYLESPYVQRWWRHARVLYGSSFRNHCEAILQSIATGAAPMIDWRRAHAGIGRDPDG